MTYIANVLAAQMLPEGNVTLTKPKGNVILTKNNITPEEAKELLKKGFQSAVGHADIARILSGMIGIEIPMNRVNVALNQGDTLIMGAYIGPRLPEGATSLPEGATIKLMKVSL